MNIEQVNSILVQPDQSNAWLLSLGLQNIARGRANLDTIARSGLTLDLLANLFSQFESFLPKVSDPDMALNNFEKFLSAARSPIGLGALLSRDLTGVPILLTIFSNSQHLSDLLIRDPESYDALRLAEGQLHTRKILVDDLTSAIKNATDIQQAMAILRRFKRRETLRIAFGDLIVGQRIEQVTEQISYVADAICEAGLIWCRQQLVKKWGQPKTKTGENGKYVILALGKLGGTELNYSSDIDLIMVYDHDGNTEQGRSNREFFDKLTREFSKLLNESTSLGSAYRVDMRLRPEGSVGPVCNSLDAILQYYGFKGRTWERQAWIKARPIAGDLDLGAELIKALQPWVYRRHLSRTDIESIKALKRQIERRALVEGEEKINVKTGLGGIRDIEFVIQFLQLLNGGNLPEIRTGNTLTAIQRLERAGCLTTQEAGILIQNYNWLRKLEHRLQIMFDLQTHNLPGEVEELKKTAHRMGFREYFGESPLEQFRKQYEEITGLNRKILDHLLHDSFGKSDKEADEPVPLIVDLVLLPDPSAELIEKGFAPFAFRDVPAAFKNLIALSKEKTSFLSPTRCRHFLAAIAPELLGSISETPDPDATLLKLSTVSDTIGAKGVLWELFNFNPPSLELYVRLCASSDYLAGILKSNPGMIDELMDSLLREELPVYSTLQSELIELTRGAEDHEPIIHSFKNTQHLRVGIRDILGRDNIQSTHRALSDVAEICVQNVARLQYEALIGKHVKENQSDVPTAEESGFIIVALGKLGGREPNYHSDLDLIFLYQNNEALKSTLKEGVSLQFFCSQLAANITKFVNKVGRFGRLYEVDSRLRPTGKSGSLAVSVDEVKRYFQSGEGQLWERQALCKSRAIFGSSLQRRVVMDLIGELIRGVAWTEQKAVEIREMRLKMQQNSTARNLKRGVGGTVDVEFIVQMLQLKHAVEFPEIVVPGTLDAIEELARAGLLSKPNAGELAANYKLLRSVEARLRLMNTTARHDLPEPGIQLEKLAYLLNYQDGESLEKTVELARIEVRSKFDQLFDSHESPSQD